MKRWGDGGPGETREGEREVTVWLQRFVLEIWNMYAEKQSGSLTLLTEFGAFLCLKQG